MIFGIETEWFIVPSLVLIVICFIVYLISATFIIRGYGRELEMVCEEIEALKRDIPALKKGEKCD